MPFSPGEQVQLRFEGDPDTALFVFEDDDYTVANGRLTVQRDGGLTVVVTLPETAGWYTYRFTSGDHVEDGTLRAHTGRRLPRAPAVRPPGPVQPRTRTEASQ